MEPPGPRIPTAEDGTDAIVRRRWEAELPREEIASLVADRRWQDLLTRLGEARARWPRDLELLRTIRVVEDHLKSHPDEG